MFQRARSEGQLTISQKTDTKDIIYRIKDIYTFLSNNVLVVICAHVLPCDWLQKRKITMRRCHVGEFYIKI